MSLTEHQDTRLPRKRLKTHRRLSLFLLSLSLMGFSIGIAFLATSVLHDYRNFRLFGFIYIILSLGLFVLRESLKYFYRIRKRKYTG